MPEDYVKVKKQSSESEGMVCCSDDSYYPYGTSLSLEDEMIEELGAENLAVGDVVEVRAFAFVDRKSEHASMGHSNRTMGLQMTAIKIRREEDDRAKQLYGSK